MKTSFHIIDPWLNQPAIVPLANLPEEMQSLVHEITHATDQKEALHHVYDLLTSKYRGYRILTFLRLDRLCITDLATLWGIKGFLHCHQMNYLFRTILLASRQFDPEDITAHWTHIWFVSPHQYLSVHLRSGETLTIDLWAKAYGISFGDYAHGFHAGSIFASTEAK